MKAKVDTGAKTSALHATNIESFGTKAKPRARFAVHPDPNNDKLEIICSTDVIGQKEVTSSNGESELRYVVRSHVQFGERAWPIDLTLTNRKNMAYRMLLGR